MTDSERFARYQARLGRIADHGGTRGLQPHGPYHRQQGVQPEPDGFPTARAALYFAAFCVLLTLWTVLPAEHQSTPKCIPGSVVIPDDGLQPGIEATP